MNRYIKTGEYEKYCEQISKLAGNPNINRDWLEEVADGMGMLDKIRGYDDGECSKIISNLKEDEN